MSEPAITLTPARVPAPASLIRGRAWLRAVAGLGIWLPAYVALEPGWALGLLVEFLAAGMTGSVNSLDVRGLKAEGGPPHDLGQFYILIDPGERAGALAERISRVAEEIAGDPAVRLPGQNRTRHAAVTVPAELWETVQALAGPQGG